MILKFFSNKKMEINFKKSVREALWCSVCLKKGHSAQQKLRFVNTT